MHTHCNLKNTFVPDTNAEQSVTRSLFQFSRREREFLSFNLMFETRTRISFSQSRASRREREFLFSISGFETRTRIEIKTILARIPVTLWISVAQFAASAPILKVPNMCGCRYDNVGVRTLQIIWQLCTAGEHEALEVKRINLLCVCAIQVQLQ